VIDAQARYALARARVELRLAELRESLDRHEADRANWARAEALERVERGLAELAKLIGEDIFHCSALNPDELPSADSGLPLHRPGLLAQ